MADAPPSLDGNRSESQSDPPAFPVYELPTQPNWSGSYYRLLKQKYVVNGVTYDHGKPRLFIGNGRSEPDPKPSHQTPWPTHQDENQSLAEAEAQNDVEEFGGVDERSFGSGRDSGRHYHGIHLTGSGFTHLGSTVGMGQGSAKNTYSDITISGNHSAMLGNVLTDMIPKTNSQHTEPLAADAQKSQQSSWNEMERHSKPYGVSTNSRDQVKTTPDQATSAGDGTATRSRWKRADKMPEVEQQSRPHELDSRGKGKAQDSRTTSWLKRHGCENP